MNWEPDEAVVNWGKWAILKSLWFAVLMPDAPTAWKSVWIMVDTVTSPVLREVLR